MGDHTVKMPDIGEGIAEAELVEWQVSVGDLVREDAVLAVVMTDKASVEVPSPCQGEVLWLGAAAGETLSIGAPLIRLRTAGSGPAEPPPDEREAKTAMQPVPQTPIPPGERPAAAEAPAPPREAAAPVRPTGEAGRPLASPAVRSRAREAGIDLRRVTASGPAGRITHEDLDRFLSSDGASAAARGGGGMREPDGSVREIQVAGLRRRIAERMAEASASVAHITYVEEVDVTALEELRASLNAGNSAGRPKLTILPFIARALVRALADHPRMNAHYDDEANLVRELGGVHLGIAAQTPNGLMVPVLRHAEARSLWDCAGEIARLGEAARSGTATRDELGGSTITVSSLGALGGIVSTPIVNRPEVAIVGVNKIAMRPSWDGSGFVPRRMMNLSSSFDHRVIDGWDAAVFVQRLKTLLETPALIFTED